MAGYILRGEEKNLTLKAAEVDAVLSAADGDAALLYLALMRADRGMTPRTLMERLHLTELRLSAAESTLQRLGILTGSAAPAAESAVPERTEFTPAEMAELLEDQEFSMLRTQVAEKLGKRMSAGDDQILAGLYHDVGLPADVIFLLVCHCIERARRRYGEGRRPTLRQIEKEGYYWARIGLLDQDSAARYLRDYARKLEGTAVYMQALQMGDRAPVESEQRYLMDWMDKGFPPETVALAYDRTVLRKQGMDWRYLNGILRRWHEAGWHTVCEVEQGEQSTAPGRSGEKKSAPNQGNSWMQQYIKR